MKPISEYNFREIVGQYIKMETPDSVKELVKNKEVIHAFCYIDQQAGISFQVIEDTPSLIILRYDEGYVIEPMDALDVTIDEKVKTKNITDDYIKNITKEQLGFRFMDLLDPYRDNQFPDDVLIETYTEPPQEILFPVWMRPLKIEDSIIIAKALETVGDIYEGDILCILPTDEGLTAMDYELYKIILEEGDKSNEKV